MRFLAVFGSSILLFLSVSCTSPLPIKNRKPANIDSMDVSTLINRLDPFEARGCSLFSGAFPFPRREKWDLCCVQHNISYWKGGSSDERRIADQRLQSCIIEVGEPNIAGLIYWRVRANSSLGSISNGNHRGGRSAAQTAPLTWGYGWALPRGYAPFSEAEERQVAELEKNIPTDFTKISVVESSTIKIPILTGNSCIDASLTFIQNELFRKLTPLRAYSSTIEITSGVFEFTFSLMAKECHKPYVFTYKTNHRDACSKKDTGQKPAQLIELKDIDYPKECY